MSSQKDKPMTPTQRHQKSIALLHTLTISDNPGMFEVALTWLSYDLQRSEEEAQQQGFSLGYKSGRREALDASKKVKSSRR